MIIRIISGIIGILVAAVVIQLGGAVFAIFAALLSLIGWHEYSNAMGKKGISTTYIIGALMLVLMLGCAWFGNIAELVAARLTNGKELVKILGNGELKAKIDVEANAFSKTAEEAIKAVGGNATII